jgi:hypothetical protein
VTSLGIWDFGVNGFIPTGGEEPMTGKRKSAGAVGRAGRSEADLSQKEAKLEQAQAARRGERSAAKAYGRRQRGQGRW